MSRGARILIRVVEAYQTAFSWRPSPCRFVPSCSNYALEAIDVHGAGRGTWLALRRVCRCHPWGAHGEDPVPAGPAPRRSVRRRSPASATTFPATVRPGTTAPERKAS